MRLLVACDQCKRQFDASGIQPGSRFHCHCGAAVIVRQPRGHDASAVRCSSCGAPRQGRVTACTHCSSDFTIHERDMHTVCPACMARVSDRARFCHHCATPLTVETVAGESTAHPCPACGKEHVLVSRRLSENQVTVLECSMCAGLWLGIDTLHTLLDQESQRGPQVAVTNLQTTAAPTRRAYRPCVICNQLMNRRNFGRGKSGVIVDVCGTHGIWFDAHELAQLVAWVRGGGLEDARMDLARLKDSKDQVRKREALRDPREERPTEPGPIPLSGSTLRDHDLFDDVGSTALRLVFRLFG